MSDWVQPEHPVTSAPFVIDEGAGIVNLSYPVGLLRLTTLAHQPVVQVIFIAEIDGKVLFAIPGEVWTK